MLVSGLERNLKLDSSHGNKVYLRSKALSIFSHYVQKGVAIRGQVYSIGEINDANIGGQQSADGSPHHTRSQPPAGHVTSSRYCVVSGV